MPNRREQLRQWYGLDFPDDLFAVWDLACQLHQKAPQDAFDAIGLHLDGIGVPRRRFDGPASGIPFTVRSLLAGAAVSR